MDQKDESILSLKNEGMSLRGIGRHIGMSHVAVRKRLNRLLDEAGNQKPETFQTGTIHVRTVNQAGNVDTKKIEFTWETGVRLHDIDNVINRLKEMIRDKLADNLEDKDIIFVTDNGWKIESVNR